jgi:hypothetical protein
MASIVLVSEGSREDARDDLRVAVMLRIEPARRADSFLVEDPERPERDVARSGVIAEGELPSGGEPVVLETMVIACGDVLDHGDLELSEACDPYSGAQV